MRIRKAVIPAAGLGTRFLPATKAIPKEMLPIVDTPVIQLIVEQAVKAGIEHIVIVTSSAKRAIEDHFDYCYELEQRLEQAGKNAEVQQVRRIADLASFSFVRQKRPLGNGHAVLCAREAIGNEPFAVLWGDDLVLADPPLVSQMADVFERYGGSVMAVMRVPEAETGRYGVIAGELVADRVYRVSNIVEKPAVAEAPSNLAVVTCYILHPEIFEILARTR
ncbi:MAG: UTP--glucose-1-phosphate uridylyltransferase, partial [Chloroflexi bacterium]|nr:UTP--glucose-1-phosphate uridylyltransferase [Chloroflexota bacterium]